MSGRDPDEEHRSSTPLELFFDLCFVVAVASAAASLHHDLAHDHPSGYVWYAAAFFAIWWAWVNYSWFASAYDSGDVSFRLLTFVVMAGVLVVAAGIPRATGEDHDFWVLVVGYVIMRVAMIPLWLRVAREHPECRTTALRYAGGIAVIQVLWVLRTALVPHASSGWVLFAVLVLLEMALPYFAEHAGRTPWHRHHIAERYELFTIIVLGEVILATTQAISGAADLDGLDDQLVLLILGSLLLVFSMWWIYFKTPVVDEITRRTAFVFGYAHYFVFASVAATGATLAVLVDVLHHDAHLGHRTALVLLAAPVSVYLLTVSGLHSLAEGMPSTAWPAVLTVATVWAVALVGPEPGTGVLLVGATLAVSIALFVRRANRLSVSAG
jgi:low temperature requirement protein LtrA